MLDTPVAANWFEYHDAVAKGITIYPPGTGMSAPSVVTNIPTTPINPSSPGGTDMDLGTLATDLLTTWGTAAIANKYNNNAQAPSVQQVDFGDYFDIPGVDIVPQPPTASCGGGAPVYKKVCGQYKWVHSKKRRRKRLATQSDLKDLAALKGILGNGKAFETWIATHS